ncbi:hypothetical protein CMEL01_03611 [Colletotrichum melonis]|uniref:Uncharacterized protein n=1 Tax=Colletotrichum melonis TaxID=1209925 RepID=A0AAI9UAN9_9PEZI|nr:hypothetical protein CMEL01_03611 [Colletotrichum melonis]
MAFASSPVDSPSSSFFAAAAAAPDLDGLAQAPASVARAILVALCDDRRVRAQALRQLERLLRFEADVREEEEEDGVKRSPNSVSSPSNPKKRKATGEPKICVQCDGIFTADENSFGSCWYHSGKQASKQSVETQQQQREQKQRETGELELWDETQIPTIWDDVSSDELDTDSNRLEYPAAFRWCCCQRLGDRQGCVRGTHEANPDRSKKGRGNELSDLEDDPLELDDASSQELGPPPHQQHYTISSSPTDAGHKATTATMTVRTATSLTTTHHHHQQQ